MAAASSPINPPAEQDGPPAAAAPEDTPPLAPHPPSSADSNPATLDSPWTVRNAKAILFLITALAAAGVYLAAQMPVALFPETDFPRIVISLNDGVMAIDQMQLAVTKPVEDAVNSVPGLKRVDSTTSRGSAEIDLFFDSSVDMFRTLQLVDAALSRIRTALPPETAIATHRLTFATFPILGYSLTSNTLPAPRLWEIAAYNIKPALSRLDGVADVAVQAEEIPNYEVVPDPARLIASHVTIRELLTALQQTNQVLAPGLYESQDALTLALVGAPSHAVEQLQQIVIKSTSAGVPIHIGDVATIRPAIEPVHSLVRADGRPAVLLNIARQPGGNIVAVADEVSREIERLNRTLPPGTTLTPFYDQSELVRDSIRSVRDAIAVGLILATATIFLFLRDWRSALVAGLVIPVTLAITVAALFLLGGSFNLMTLGGLTAAVGLVIDDAIVVIENIVRRRAAGEQRVNAIRNALHEVTLPLTGSTLTPIAVFLPLMAISGVTGGFFRALALTMSLALFTSLLLALTWTPALYSVLLGKRDALHLPTTSPDLTSRIMGLYQRCLEKSLAHPSIVLGACSFLLLASFLGYRSLGSDLLPKMDEGAFVLDYTMPPGSSFALTDRVLQDVERILKNNPDVDHLSRRTGRQMGLAAVTEANTGDITVKLKPNRKHSIDEVIDEVRSEIKTRHPMLDVEFTQVLQDMVNDLSSAPEPIELKLFNPDPQLLADAASRVAAALSKQPGVVDVQDGLENTMSGPATVFTVRPSIAAQSGFTTEDVAIDISAVIEGVESRTSLLVDGRPYPIRIRFPEESRADLRAIQSNTFESPSGHLSTLGDLADAEQIAAQQEVRRENLQRMLAVTGRLEGSDLGSAIERVRSAVQALHLPPEVRIEYGGGYQSQQDSFRDITKVSLLALVLVFAVLLAEFRNFAAPLAILASSLLSTAGSILALLLTGMTFNVPSFIGLVMTVGIVAKNGILLLDAEARFTAAGFAPDEALLQAGQRRLRPILMTALAAIMGMLPLALALGPGSQILQPLAIATIGGLLLATVLSLFVTPCIYNRLRSVPT